MFEREDDPARRAFAARRVVQAAERILGTEMTDTPRLEQALELASTAAETLYDSDDPSLLELAAAAYLLALDALARVGRHDDAEAIIDQLTQLGDPAITVLEKVAANLDDNESPVVQHALVAALSARVLALLEQDREDEAITALDGILERFANTPFAGDLIDGARELRDELLDPDS